MTNKTFKYCYDIHGILRIGSSHRLPELGFFRVSEMIAPADIVVRTNKPKVERERDSFRKSIHYDDGLARFGFDIDIDYGDTIVVTVSRMVAASEHVLYTNVIEPLLRWSFVQKGYVLMHAACLSFNNRAVLVTAKTDTGKTSTIIHMIKHNPACEFLSDDMTIVRADGFAMCYPKPMTISFHTLNAAKTAPLPALRRIALQIQSRLHSKSGRKIGLTLGNSRIPAATLNAIVQWLVPPPKYMIDQLIPNAKYGLSSPLTHAFVIERSNDTDSERVLSQSEIVCELSLNSEDAYGFPPYPIIGSQMFIWDGEDLHAREHLIIEQALTRCSSKLLRSASFGWWKSIPRIVQSAPRQQHSESEISESSLTSSAHVGEMLAS